MIHTQHEQIVAPPPAPSRGERFAARVVQVGCVAVVLVAVTWRDYELDRFFVPKELVLHATALLAGIPMLRRVPRIEFRAADLLLCAFLLVSCASALFAQNGWLAVRALAVSGSGIALFWTVRALATAGLGRRVVHAVAIAAALGAGTALLQTYGVRTDLFSLNRAPGGTLGNRNFVAHMAAFAMPVLLLIALRTGSGVRAIAAAAGATVLAATVVLTRSRAGLLALVAVVTILLLALALAPALRQSARVWLRLALTLVIAGAGIAAAVFTPNSLRWRGENPYMESIAGVTNYQEGSGAGRLVQYRQSMRMTVANPLFGVGPGNWSVEYPEYAAGNDPSLSARTPGTTSNPWPSSDWVAFLSERGLMAALALVLAFAALMFDAVRRLRTATRAGDAAAAYGVIALLVAAAVAGMFDAVLLLPLPALLVWTAVGALWQPQLQDGRIEPPHGLRTIAFAAVLFLALAGALRSAAQLTAMGIHSTSTEIAALRRAASIDPGNYRLHVRLARSGLPRAVRCEHARTAHDLFPSSREARTLARGCD